MRLEIEWTASIVVMVVALVLETLDITEKLKDQLQGSWVTPITEATIECYMYRKIGEFNICCVMFVDC